MKNLIIRIFISIIIFFFILYSEDKHYFNYISNNLFYSNIDFSYIKSKTNYLRGKLINKDIKYVNSNKFIYKNVERINNSYKFLCDEYYVINNFKSGVVIYIGEKEELGSTVIVNSDNGINYWYSNIENISVNLYDYIDSGKIIGSVKDSNFILTLTKDGKYLNYEKYI